MNTNTSGLPIAPIDPIGQRLLDAQKEGAYERVVQARSQSIHILDTPAITDHDKQLAKEWKTKISIDEGNALYQKYAPILRNVLRKYFESVGIDRDTLRHMDDVLAGLKYSTTYKDHNEKGSEDIGEAGGLSVNITDIYHIPLDISMLQVQRYMVRNFLGDISTKVMTAPEAIEVQYLMILLHEFAHAISIRIHTLTDGKLGRVGIQFLEMNGEKIGDHVHINETLTDFIAGMIYHSEVFQEAFPLARKVGYANGYMILLPDFIDAFDKWGQAQGLSSQEALDEVQRLFLSSDIEDVLELHSIFASVESPDE